MLKWVWDFEGGGEVRGGRWWLLCNCLEGRGVSEVWSLEGG